jgi:ABC-type antimicrobial peptide transport system permease subunit
LAHSLASSLRGRRRELAIMAALGLERRQLAATVLWHAIAVALAAAFLATPAGAAVGRVAWRAFAGEFHVPARPVVPLPTFAAVVLAAMVVAAVAAVPFAVRAARTRPAGVLRTE